MAKTRVMTYSHVNYSVFTDAVRKLQRTEAELSVAIGYSSSASRLWKKAGSIPKVAGLACECLLRRNRIEEDAPEPITLFVLRVADRHMLAFQAFTDAVGIPRTMVGAPGEG